MKRLASLLGIAGLTALLVFAWPRIGVSIADDHVSNAVHLHSSLLTESSGLAISGRDSNCVWSHNDSGDEPRLFCFDRRTGEQTGSCKLVGADAIDWEDMTCIPGETPQLVVADCGDNQSKREFVTLYLFDEPDPRATRDLMATQWRSIRVQYPTGPMDCEAVWYDKHRDQIILLGKSAIPLVQVFAVDRPTGIRDASSENRRVLAKQVCSLALPMATGADCDRQSGDIWIVTYWQAWRFARHANESISEQLLQTPTAFELPAWRQIEAVCIDDQSQVWISSEGIPTPLGQLNRKISAEPQKEPK